VACRVYRYVRRARASTSARDNIRCLPLHLGRRPAMTCRRMVDGVTPRNVRGLTEGHRVDGRTASTQRQPPMHG
jgi:hypothetical protein